MRFLAMTDPGGEAACAIEVQRILGKQARREGGLVLFEATLEEACTFTWRTQTAQRVLLDIGAPQRLEHARFLSGTFKVVGERIEETATWLLNETRLTVNLTAPDVTIVTRGPYTGLDLGGELWKRDWRVMLSNHSLKATIAASAVVYGGVTGRIVDPYCDDGSRRCSS